MQTPFPSRPLALYGMEAMEFHIHVVVPSLLNSGYAEGLLNDLGSSRPDASA